MPWDEAPEEPEDSWSRSPEYGAVPDWADPEPQGVFCSEWPPGDYRRAEQEWPQVERGGHRRVQSAHLWAGPLP